MRIYTVYRFDYLTKKTETIGTVVERRKKERRINNISGMVRVAQKEYGLSSIDSHIYILPDTDSESVFNHMRMEVSIGNKGY